MSTTTTVLDQDTTPASPAPSTNAQAGTSATIHLSSQYAAVDATLGYMTGLSEMMDHLQTMLNDRFVNQWDYIQHNFDDMSDMAKNQFQASMSSAVGSLVGAGFNLGTTLKNSWDSRALTNKLGTQQKQKTQLEELAKFLRGGPAGNGVEVVGGAGAELGNAIEMNNLNPRAVNPNQRDNILNGLRKQGGKDFLDDDLNPKTATKAEAIRNTWDDETVLPPDEKGRILRDLDNAIASKKDDIKSTQAELSLSQETWAQWGKVAEGLCTAGGTMGQAYWGRDAKMDEADSMLDSAVVKSMEQAAQNADSSIKTFANQLSSLADALQKTLYVQQRA